MKITLLTDNPRSWFVPFADRLHRELEVLGHGVARACSIEEVDAGDCLFLLSCEKIVPPEVLKRNRHNIVIHASALPAGKGMSPLTWQILEGANRITVTLFEASEEVDNGEIYLQKNIQFEGHELIEELREKEGSARISLALEFVENFDRVTPRPQTGPASFYPRRNRSDSELDPNKTISEQFNLLRIVDNERYPAFFRHRGRTYILKIFEQGDKEDDSDG